MILLSLSKVFAGTDPVIKNTIETIERIDPQAIDPALKNAESVLLSVDQSGDSTGMTLHGDRGSFAHVEVQKDPLQAVWVSAALPTKERSYGAYYDTDGQVTEPDGKTVIDRNKQAEAAALRALPGHVIAALTERLERTT